MKYLLVLFALMLALNGCGNSGGSDSPANSIKDFVKAVKEGNTEKAWTYLSDASQKQFDASAKQRSISGKDAFIKDFKNPKSLGNLYDDFEVIDEKKEDNNAKVTIKFSSGKTLDVYSIKEGAWKYDLVRTNKELMKLVE
ncbi:MAG: DUF4878 domain-containing protein [Bacteroidetes bacterium]|nr:DUF4878 domain-containing protein [Bacteroidota bacterium]MBX7045787.1 DUF4878 domain-containing protein [Ignavibacteria bacterium]